MKKVIILSLMAVFLITSTSYAKTIKFTSEEVAEETSSAVKKVTFNVVKYTLKTIAVPFYWLEKISDRDENSSSNTEDTVEGNLGFIN